MQFDWDGSMLFNFEGRGGEPIINAINFEEIKARAIVILQAEDEEVDGQDCLMIHG
jgi:hypothetical protein